MAFITSVSLSQDHKDAIARHHLSASDCIHYGILLKCNERDDFSLGKHRLYEKIEKLVALLEAKGKKK